MDSFVEDEEMARALQAMDNGLRKRKRSTSGTEETRFTAITKSKGKSSSKSETTPSRKSKGSPLDSPSSPHSAASAPSPASTHEHAAEVPGSMEDSFSDCDSFCLACGKLFAGPSSSPDPTARSVTTPSKENHLICSVCLVRYSLSPYKAHAAVKASPSHRCEGHGCSVTFMTAERLRDHQERVHGVATKVV